jgi:hypothetical protein
VSVSVSVSVRLHLQSLCLWSPYQNTHSRLPGTYLENTHKFPLRLPRMWRNSELNPSRSMNLGPKFMSQSVNPWILFPVLDNVGTELNGRRRVNPSQSHSVINPRGEGTWFVTAIVNREQHCRLTSCPSILYRCMSGSVRDSQ